MKNQFARIVAGAGFVAGCCLMQGCVSNKVVEPTPPPDIDIEEIEPTPAPPPEVVEIKPVAATTAYVVQKDDTLSGIAVRYGLRWQDVVAVNPGISPNKLQIGQVIQLPGQVDLSKPVVRTAPPKPAAPVVAGEVYVVKSGDSLSEIALKHGVKVEDIRKANDLKDVNKLSIGQKLKIPGAKTVTTAPPKPTETPPNVTPPVKVAPPPPVKTDPEVIKAAPPAPDKEAAIPTTGQTYVVKEGEDLYSVAIKWGVSPSDLKVLNNLEGSDLRPGMTLKIPSGAQ